MVNFQASPPKISAHRVWIDQGMPSRFLSRMTTATQMMSLRTSLRKTAVEVKYRAPFTTGIIRE